MSNRMVWVFDEKEGVNKALWINDEEEMNIQIENLMKIRDELARQLNQADLTNQRLNKEIEGYRKKIDDLHRKMRDENAFMEARVANAEYWMEQRGEALKEMQKRLNEKEEDNMELSRIIASRMNNDWVWVNLITIRKMDRLVKAVGVAIDEGFQHIVGDCPYCNTIDAYEELMGHGK